MEPLLTTFIAAALAEFGDKTQLLVIALAVHYRKPWAVLAGATLGALANSLIAASGGILIGEMINLRATSLLVAVALIFAGVAGLIRPQAPDYKEGWKLPAFAAAAISFFAAEFGDRTQFMTAALAAQYDALVLAALGATAGIAAANLPAVLLGARAHDILPLRAIRLGSAACFILFGLIVAVDALRLT